MVDMMDPFKLAKQVARVLILQKKTYVKKYF